MGKKKGGRMMRVPVEWHDGIMIGVSAVFGWIAKWIHQHILDK